MQYWILMKLFLQFPHKIDSLAAIPWVSRRFSSTYIPLTMGVTKAPPCRNEPLKNYGTSLWNSVPNFGLRKIHHGELEFRSVHFVHCRQALSASRVEIFTIRAAVGRRRIASVRRLHNAGAYCRHVGVQLRQVPAIAPAVAYWRSRCAPHDVIAQRRQLTRDALQLAGHAAVVAFLARKLVLVVRRLSQWRHQHHRQHDSFARKSSGRQRKHFRFWEPIYTHT